MSRIVARLLAMLAAAALLAPAPALAAAPANDEPAGAIVLQPRVPVEFDSSNATDGADDPTSCSGSNGFWPGPFFASVWFSYTPTRTGITYLDAPTTVGHPDDYLAISFVFEQTTGGLVQVDCRAFSNDAGWVARAGTTYLIMLAGLSSDATGFPPLSDRGGHGTVTVHPVPGRSIGIDEHFTHDIDFGCSDATVTETATTDAHRQVFFRRDGSIDRYLTHNDYRGTITNHDTGQVLRDDGHWTDSFDPDTGTFRQVGMIYAVVIPGQGVVLLDAGVLIVDALGGVTVRGPHEVFDGADICAALGAGTTLP